MSSGHHDPSVFDSRSENFGLFAPNDVAHFPLPVNEAGHDGSEMAVFDFDRLHRFSQFSRRSGASDVRRFLPAVPAAHHAGHQQWDSWMTVEPVSASGDQDP